MKVQAFLLTAIFGLLASCGIDPLSGDTDVKSTLEYLTAQAEFQGIQTTFDIEAQLSGELNKNYQGSGFFCFCSSVEVFDNADGTFSMIIDYGQGCTCQDGRTRSGKLTGTFSGKWNESGTLLEIVPEQYRVTGLNGETYTVSFVKRITRSGNSPDGAPRFSVEVRDAVFTSSAGSFSWSSSRTVDWIEGVGDQNPESNVYRIQGSGNGISSDGLPYTVNINAPLIVRLDCPHIVSGVLSLTPQDKSSRRIDFGEGACDGEATVSVEGFSRKVTLF